MEKWKPCYGYEDTIEVSNKGRVRSTGFYSNNGSKKIYNEPINYSQSNDKDGYKLINISRRGVRKTFRVHRLILLSFEYNENHERLTVNHKDGIKDNNKLCNLEWATYKENTKHAINMGLITHKSKKLYNKKCGNCNKKYKHEKKRNKFCSRDCFNKNRRVVERPNKEQLKKDIKNLPMTKVGKKYNVSDNAVRKWCKFYGLPSTFKEINKMKYGN